MAIPGTAAAAGAVLQQGVNLINLGTQLKDRSISSLSQYVKDTNIIFRFYVDQMLANEPVVKDLSGMMNHVTLAYVMVALRLNDLCQNGRTVRDLLKVVSTEAYVDAVELITDRLGVMDEHVIALEAIEEKDSKTAGRPMSVVELDKAATGLYTGKVIEVTLGTKDRDQQIKMYIYMQMIPYILPTEVISGFARMNFVPGIYRRYLQWRAGEIRFWKDFVFESDLAAKRAAILKADKDGIFREIEDHRTNSLIKKIGNIFGAGQKVNASNVIICAERDSFMRVCAEVGFDIKNYNQRQKFFAESMSMILLLVDQRYQQVDMFINGLEPIGTYTFDMIKQNGKSKDSIDIQQVMQMIAAGNALRF